MRSRLLMHCLAVMAAFAVAAGSAEAGSPHPIPPLNGTPKTPVSPSARPSIEHGALAARLLRPTKLYRSPDLTSTPYATLGTTTKYTGAAATFVVAHALYDVNGHLLLQILVPRREGRRAWIDATGVELQRRKNFVRVHLRTRTVDVWRLGRKVRSVRAVIGAPSTPTPTGLYAIYEAVRASADRGFTGPWALHLTAFSPVLDRFGAGDGRIALHGRGPAALGDPLGTARSHGCIRINNAEVAWLRMQALPGTPVQILG